MNRIVIDARELRTSSGRYVERLLHYLQKIDHDNEYQVLLKPNDMEWVASSPNFHKVACPHKEFTFGEQMGLKRQITRLNADLVHFAFAQQPIWYRGKTVTTVHDLTTLRFDNPDKNRFVFKFKQVVYARVIKRAVHKATAVMTGSKFVKDDLVNFAGLNPEKVNVTYEAADRIDAPAEKFAGLTDKGFIMYVGRPTPHKNLERLIKAFRELKETHPELQLVLAGKLDGNYRRIKAGVEKQGVEGVVFTDFVSEGQLRWLYENCRAYVFPSLSEGFGLPGLEAMSQGAAVVSSNATCLPEIYGEAAHYFDPLNVQAMATAINDVLSNDKLRDELIKKGAEQVRKYSWQKTAEQTLVVYQKALKS